MELGPKPTATPLSGSGQFDFLWRLILASRKLQPKTLHAQYRII
jgi:hypothetical protein